MNTFTEREFVSQIAVIFPGNERGGAATHLRMFAKSVVAADLTDEVRFLSAGTGPLHQAIYETGVPVTELPGSLRALWGVLRHQMRDGTACWHAHGPRLNVLVGSAAMRTQTPWTSTIHSHPQKDFLGSRMKSLLFTRANLGMLKRTVGLFVGNPAFADLVPDVPSYFVPNAVEWSPPSAAWREGQQRHRAAVRKQFGIPEDAFVVGTVARFDPVKDIPTVIRAISQLESHTSTPVHLLLTGDGEQMTRLHAEAETLGIDAQVHFPGFVDDVQPFYHAMDVHVTASLSEGVSPFAVLEAGVGFVPTVASDIAGHRNLMEDGVSGLLFTPGDVDGLASRLELLLHATDRRMELAENFQSKVLPRFSQQAMLEHYLQGYAEMGFPLGCSR